MIIICLCFYNFQNNSQDRKVLQCRTTKLLSQKRRHIAAFCISFYWQKGTRPKKRRDYYLKKSPSSCILHQSHCKRMLWLRQNRKIYCEIERIEKKINCDFKRLSNPLCSLPARLSLYVPYNAFYAEHCVSFYYDLSYYSLMHFESNASIA